MKNVSRSKFFLCFRPVVDVHQLVLDSKTGIDRSKNIEKKRNSKHFTSNSSVLDSGCSTSSSENHLILRSPKKTTFSRLIKAVLLEAVLSKRVRDQKQCPLNSERSLDNTSDDNLSNKVVDVRSLEPNSSSFDPSSSSSLSCRLSSISEPKVHSKMLYNMKRSIKLINQELELLKAKKMGNCGIYLILLSLTGTIFWGKLCAIIFTSILLYFLPRLVMVDNICQSDKCVGITRSELQEKKKTKDQQKKIKRVIMEGLLDRNHHQISPRGLELTS